MSLQTSPRAAPAVLTETAHVVWPDARELQVTRSTKAPAGSRDWVVLPSVATPRWLLPADAPATARALVGQEPTRTRQVAATLVARAHRAGLVHRVPVRRLRVDHPGDDSLEATLRRMLRTEVDVAIRLGSWRHARSVVVRLFASDGTTLAFGKLGVDDLGRTSVREEARALARVAQLDLTQVVHSEVVGREVWRGLEVLLVTPLLLGRGDDDDGLPVAAMRELAGAAGSRVGPLSDSAWWTGLSERVVEVADPSVREELGSHVDHLRWVASGTAVPLGPSHGDWTPWNMAWKGGRVLLWDWEHFAEDVPVGFDHSHFLAQQLRVSSGTGPDVEATWLELAHVALQQHIGLDHAARDLVLAAYLLEVNLRYVLDRQGTPQEVERRAGWGLEMLRRRVQDLPHDPG